MPSKKFSLSLLVFLILLFIFSLITAFSIDVPKIDEPLSVPYSDNEAQERDREQSQVPLVKSSEYRNDRWKLVFSYPEHFHIETEDSEHLRLLFPRGDLSPSITVDVSYTNLGFDEWFESDESIDIIELREDKIVSQEVVGGKEVFVLRPELMGRTYYVFERPGKIVTFGLIAYNETHDTVLDSIIFLDQDTVDVWKLYQNNDFDFSVRYPDSIDNLNYEYWEHFFGVDHTASLGFGNNDFNFHVSINPFAEELYAGGKYREDKKIKINGKTVNLSYHDPLKEHTDSERKTLYTIFYDDQENMYSIQAFISHVGFESLMEEIIQSFRFAEPIDTSDWSSFQSGSNRYGFLHPSNWKIESESLNSFIPPFAGTGIRLASGVFDNYESLTIEEWIELNDFFALAQYQKDPDGFVGHGIADPIAIYNETGARSLLYYGGAEGGGSFGTWITSLDDTQMLVLSYTLVPNWEHRDFMEERLETENIFKEVIDSVFITSR